MRKSIEILRDNGDIIKLMVDWLTQKRQEPKQRQEYWQYCIDQLIEELR